MAVWVGVSSAIAAKPSMPVVLLSNEVKHRVPIWKKEHYRSGDSGWVNCEALCGGRRITLTPTRDKGAMQPDYSRQTLLKEIGAQGQAALARGRVLRRRRRRPRQPGTAILGWRRSRLLRDSRRRHPRRQQFCIVNRSSPWRMSVNKKPNGAGRGHANQPDRACRITRHAARRRQRARVDPRLRRGGRLQRQFSHQVLDQRRRRTRAPARSLRQCLPIRRPATGLQAGAAPRMPALPLARRRR